MADDSLLYVLETTEPALTVDVATMMSTSNVTIDGLLGSSDVLDPPGSKQQQQTRLPWAFISKDDCLAYYADFITPSEDYCNATFDTLECWPPTPPNQRVKQPCPPVKGVDPNNYAIRFCLPGGIWQGRFPGDTSLENGYTNYTPCYTPAVRDLISKLYSGGEGQEKLRIARAARHTEIVGLCVSLVSLLLSLFIYKYFSRKLRNYRKRIHRNLFTAMLIQVLIRLILYVDQAIVRGDNPALKAEFSHETRGIDNTVIVCESFYVLLEYARTAMFMWMFIEGMYLNKLISVAYFQRPDSYKLYYVIGWGVPAVMTAIWAAVTAVVNKSKCWWGYAETYYYFFLEGPRLIVILLNFLFLLNIIRILITKLKETKSTEAEQVRTSVRAAIVLLPLLGITNITSMVPAPLGRSAIEFALWSFPAAILTSFQGFMVALIYCFCNHEVKRTLLTFWRLKVTLREGRQRSRGSSLFEQDPMYLNMLNRQPSVNNTTMNHCYQQANNNANGGVGVGVGVGAGITGNRRRSSSKSRGRPRHISFDVLTYTRENTYTYQLPTVRRDPSNGHVAVSSFVSKF